MEPLNYEGRQITWEIQCMVRNVNFRSRLSNFEIQVCEPGKFLKSLVPPFFNEKKRIKAVPPH